MILHIYDISPNVIPIKLEHIVPYLPHRTTGGCSAKQGLEDGQEQGGCEDMEDVLRGSWMIC